MHPRLSRKADPPASSKPRIRVHRIYDLPLPRTGRRYLVDRLWPRGVRKEDLRLDGWLKDLAPSEGLRRWFGHRPDRWEAFQERYFAELDGKAELIREILDASRRPGGVVLLYGARDREHNNAVALKAYLERIGGRACPAHGAAQRVGKKTIHPG